MDYCRSEPDVEGERILEYALAFDLLLGNTCFKTLGQFKQIRMGVRTGAAGVVAAAPIFLPIIKIGISKKNENEKKGRKVCFLMQRFFVRFTGVIFANRDNCPPGVKD